MFALARRTNTYIHEHGHTPPSGYGTTWPDQVVLFLFLQRPTITWPPSTAISILVMPPTNNLTPPPSYLRTLTDTLDPVTPKSRCKHTQVSYSTPVLVDLGS